MPQMHWLDRLSLAMARGTSRKDFLKLAGATVAGLVAGDAAVVEAKKSKGPTCATGLTACAAAPPSDDGPTAAKKSKGPAPVCRDLTSDVNSCGACGATGATGQTCSASKCQ